MNLPCPWGGTARVTAHGHAGQPASRPSRSPAAERGHLPRARTAGPVGVAGGFPTGDPDPDPDPDPEPGSGSGSGLGLGVGSAADGFPIDDAARGPGRGYGSAARKPRQARTAPECELARTVRAPDAARAASTPRKERHA
ncbi:hypothetical protein [Streptomyces sp. NPDC050704]|uniref:hypothetical protein n=1 Tax=Streptomyces sp. NPDC050704 TaxID=3157219 RepID=UPI00342753E8